MIDSPKSLRYEIQDILTQETDDYLHNIDIAQQKLKEYSSTNDIFSDPNFPNTELLHGYITAGVICRDVLHLFPMAEAFLLQGWQYHQECQLATGKKVYAAAIAIHLFILYYRLGDRASAMRWALLTHANDMLWSPSSETRGGNLHLRITLGMSAEALKIFDQIAINCVRLADRNGWSYPEGYADEVVRRFALHEATSHLFGDDSLAREFSISQAYFKSLLDRARTAPKAEKGDALENLATYLALLIPGCVPLSKVEDEQKTSEHDVVVRNLNLRTNITSEILGRHFLIETKNWKKKVNAANVAIFLSKIRLSHAQFGIMFSVDDITGKANDATAARGIIRRTFHEDRIICVVVSDKDLERLAAGKETFWWMLLRKIELIRFGKSKLQFE